MDKHKTETNDSVPERRHKPKQSRSVETRASILQAAAEQFGEEGYESSTTHQIAARAGVSVGTLYRYFSDKEAVLLEVYEREMSGLRNRILEEFAAVDVDATDVRGLVHESMALALRVYREKPRLRRVLSEQARRNPALATLRRSQEDAVHAAVERILSVVPGVQVPDLQVGAYLVSLFMESVIEDHCLYPREDRVADDDRVIAGAADFILSYLLRQGAPG